MLFGFVLPYAGMDFILVLSHDLLGSTSTNRESTKGFKMVIVVYNLVKVHPKLYQAKFILIIV